MARIVALFAHDVKSREDSDDSMDGARGGESLDPELGDAAV